MIPLRHTAVLGLAAVLCPAVGAEPSRNFFPFWVDRTERKETLSWQAIGPLGFVEKPSPDHSYRGIRPFYLDLRFAPDADTTREQTWLYPLLSHREGPYRESWSLLNLVNFDRARNPRAPAADSIQALDIWPFYFSRDTGKPESTYHAVFPLYGDVPNRFGQDRMQWTLFPLYGRFVKNGVTTTTTPWPFIKVLSGEGNHGFEFWPLYGQRAKANTYEERFVLWPIYHHRKERLWAEQPNETLAVLPFYARETKPGYRSETFGWPFFGYVDRTEPYRYHATNYFWPFLVQGRGDQRMINRWAPFYTHSKIKGNEKTWVMWPLWRQESTVLPQIQQKRQQLLYFVYHNTTQYSRANPNAAPARKTHLWPLFSRWDNGAGQTQLQVVSPFEVFFPQSEQVRRGWTPLFALYRYEHEPAGERHHELLWNLVTYDTNPPEGEKAFRLGPLLSVDATQGEGHEVRILQGLISWGRNRREGRWHFAVGPFGRRPRPESNAPAPNPAPTP